MTELLHLLTDMLASVDQNDGAPGSRLPPEAYGDAAVSRALACIHGRYAEELTIDQLARAAGVSRAVLGKRFLAYVGQSPMRYCGHWRMQIAAKLLREGQQNTASVAYAVGFTSEAAFNRAFKREFGEPPATWRRHVEADAKARQNAVAPPSERISFCHGRDGVRLAYATAGSGFPIVKAPNWMTHLQHDWSSPVYGHWHAELVSSGQLVRMDMRGFGMSDWRPPQMSFETLVGDLAAVIDDAGVEQFDLLGISHGAAIAIAYAARNPDRVRKLVLLNSFAQGWAVRADPEEMAWRSTLLDLNRKEWSRRRVALGEMFVTLYFPSADRRLIDWHNERIDLLSDQQTIEGTIHLAAHIDVSAELARIQAPTLVCHCRQDGNALLAVGRLVAEGIAGARFVELDSANHVLLADEPAWPVFTREMRAFLRS